MAYNAKEYFLSAMEYYALHVDGGCSPFPFHLLIRIQGTISMKANVTQRRSAPTQMYKAYYEWLCYL